MGITKADIEASRKMAADPVLFVRAVLGVKPTAQQAVLLREAAKPGAHVSVRSGHGCFGAGTLVKSYTNRVLAVEDVRVGQSLMGDDGTPREVLALVRGEQELVKFTWQDGREHVYNLDHLLCLEDDTGVRLHMSVREFVKNYEFVKYKYYSYRFFNHVWSRAKVRRIDYIGEDKYYGFTLDGNHMFRGEDGTILHNCGKSTALAWMIWWFLLFNEDVKIPCTAPSAHQLNDVLWAELAKWREKMHPGFKEATCVTQDKAFVVGCEKTRFAVARTARKENPEALAGFHANNLILLCDEASAVPEEIFEVAEGALSTPGARMIMTSNPTRTSGYFYNTHRHPRVCSKWTRINFSCLKSPLVSPKFAEEMKEKYGEDSNVYRVRVIGDFPLAGDNTVVPRHWVEAALGRELTFDRSVRVAGLDVARFGSDKSALVVRQGGKVVHIEQWSGAGIDETIGRVIRRYNEGLFQRLYVDSIGIGAGVVDILPHHGVPVVGINVGESSSSREQFNRLRDELWWNVREWFGEKQCTLDKHMPLVDELVTELCEPSYKYTPSGKIKIESKDEMKARGVPSPNLADALCLALYGHQHRAPIALAGALADFAYDSPDMLL